MEGQFFKDLGIKPNYFLNINNNKNYNKNFLNRAVNKLVKLYKLLKPNYIININRANIKY